MEYYVYQGSDGELYHWGVKGMRWGVRRYQNKDGSLTAAGKKRRAKLEGELEKLGGKKTSKNNEEPTKKKTVSEMSNKELQEHTTRMQLEKNYYDVQRQLSIANPPKVSAGKKFVNSMLNDVITPAAKNAGRTYLEKFMKDKLGLNQEDSIAKLEKQVKKLKLTKEIEDLKKSKNDSGYSLDELLEAYRNIPEETRTEVKDAATFQENLNKINKKKN